MTDLRKLLAVGPGTVDLAAIDPAGTPGVPDERAIRAHPKRWSRSKVAAIGAELTAYQEKLYASGKQEAQARRVLLVLQAMDCGGKDGTVSAVTGGMNPAGLSVVSFGPPTEDERTHDFLWRIRRALPAPGRIGIFNRSHYEDVLVARVHELVPEPVWSARYDEINAFEAELVAGGLTLVKVMLHISPEEQKKRLLARLDDPTKQWKFNPADLTERERWNDYQQAYADALSKCSTDVAPWHVVPADHKWYRNWAVATLVRQALADIDPQYPPASFDVAAERAKLLNATPPARPRQAPQTAP
jgi:PPK2 family polyphosphate:nucleotide phosphotransferase